MVSGQSYKLHKIVLAWLVTNELFSCFQRRNLETPTQDSIPQFTKRKGLPNDPSLASLRAVPSGLSR